METFQTEEQQVEAIKKFWQENGNSLIVGLVIGLGGFIGWNYYQNSQLQAQYQASYEYQQAMDAYSNKEAEYKTNTQAFIDNNSDQVYAVFAAFALAKDAVDANDFAEAEKQLLSAQALADSTELSAIATLRLARVQLQQQAFDKVFTTLSSELPESFKASAAEIKGDAHLLQGNKQQARAEYQVAADAGGLKSNPTLQMKLDDLAIAVNS